MDNDRARRIGLGTVQWGLDYGVANKSGRTTDQIVERILVRAGQAGANLLDTAAAYGEAEDVIGRLRSADPFEVITKTIAYDTRLQVGSARVSHVIEGFRRSLSRLQRDSVSGLLVHHSEELLAPHGLELWARLVGLKEEGRVGRLGASVYAPDQLEDLLASFPLEIVQLPFNVFDQRFLRSGLLDRLHRMGVEVHIRSAFLQGVVLMQDGVLPPFLGALAPAHALWRKETAGAGMSFVGSALGFCLQHPAVSRVIVGCDSAEQADMLFNAALERYVELPDMERFDIRDAQLIDPRNWPARS